MALSKQERVKGQLLRKFGKEICNGGWRFWGMEFMNFSCPWINGVGIYVKFTANLRYVKVNLSGEEYGLQDRVKMFASDDALTEAIDWAADMVVEMVWEVTRRTEPYVEGHLKYERALRGEA